jgi:MFS family permease
MATAAAHPMVQTPRAEGESAKTVRSLAIATAANVLGLTAHTTYMYYLAPIALREGSFAADALIFSLVAIAMGLSVVPSGRLADRIARRYVMRIGLALLGVAYLGVILPPSVAAIVAGTLATGVGLALLFVSFQSYVADLLHATKRGVAYGRAGALGVLASAAGPFLAALVFRFVPDARIALLVNGVLFGAAAFAGILLTMRLPSVRAPTHAPEERGHWREAARAASPAALVYVFMGAGYGMTAPYFTVHFLDDLRYASESWGYLLAAGTVLSALGSMAAGELGRRMPPIRVALVGMVGLLASSLLFALPLHAAFFALGFLGRSLFSTTVGPAVSTLTMERARPARRAEAQSYASLAWNAGWAVGGAVGGALLVALGGGLFALGGLLALLGTALGALMLASGSAKI